MIDKVLAWMEPVLLVLVPAVLILCAYFQVENTALLSLMTVVLALVPYFLRFERRHPRPRDIMPIVVLAAIAAVGRILFAPFPNVKPVTAIVIVSGACLGPQSGFLTGALAALSSNLFFGQGPWTPWQMFAMGCIGGLAGSLFSRRGRRPRKGMLCLFGFLAAVVLYGAVMNTASVLLWSHSLQWELIAAACAAGLPMDLLHGGSTALLLYLLADPVQGKLDRMREKYGWGRG